MMIDRRSVLAGAASSLALSVLGSPLRAIADVSGLKLGKPQPFSFDALINDMRQQAASAYVADSSLPQGVLDRIGYDEHGKLKFDTGNALFREGPGQYPVTFFALGKYFRIPVHMFVLSPAGHGATASEILYDSAYFSMAANSPARELPKGAGFAGFRLQESRMRDGRNLDWHGNDWAAFLGAAYFRGIGELGQYGLSARGIAVDVSTPGRREEFPDFTRFYFEPPPVGANQMVIYAALDGPSLTGAYRFVLQRNNGVMMEVDARLFPRRDINQLGIAPMSSMFWFSETIKPTAIDWRPEVHDSDGLALWTGSGEYIWRPLNDPDAPSVSTFDDKAPRGFGLLQRDRNFDHYLDGVRYDRRPSLWVQPLHDWGEGAVQLIELPTEDETEDNIVAMWVPKQPVTPRSSLRYRYRLQWCAVEPHETDLARCVATRLGRGGEPGKVRPKGVHKFVVEFLGGPLAALPFGVKPKPILSTSSGSFSNVFTEAVPDGVHGHWRAQFDFTGSGPKVIDMRLYLKNGEQTLSETWLYQFHIV
jgi:periplasmic glucans biosynthesis protein